MMTISEAINDFSSADSIKFVIIGAERLHDIISFQRSVRPLSVQRANHSKHNQIHLLSQMDKYIFIIGNFLINVDCRAG